MGEFKSINVDIQNQTMTVNYKAGYDSDIESVTFKIGEIISTTRRKDEHWESPVRNDNWTDDWP